MLRVFRLGDMIAKTNAEEATKAIMKLLQLMFYLAFYLHVMGCYLWIAVGYNAPEKFYVNYERTMYVSDENSTKHIFWDPIFCAEAGETCLCGELTYNVIDTDEFKEIEGTYNLIFAKKDEDYNLDYDSKSNVFEKKVDNTISSVKGVVCPKKEGQSDSCFCDPVGEYDLLWGPPRSIGDGLWPDGRPVPTGDSKEEKEYAEWDAEWYDSYKDTWSDYPRMWYAPLDWIDFTQSKYFSNDYQFAMQYSSMLYYGVLILGSNELGPINEIEMLFMIVVLLMSALLNALIFGDIATLAQIVGKKGSELQEKLDAANSVMDNIKLEYEVQ